MKHRVILVTRQQNSIQFLLSVLRLSKAISEMTVPAHETRPCQDWKTETPLCKQIPLIWGMNESPLQVVTLLSRGQQFHLRNSGRPRPRSSNRLLHGLRAKGMAEKNEPFLPWLLDCLAGLTGKLHICCLALGPHYFFKGRLSYDLIPLSIVHLERPPTLGSCSF